MARSHRTTITIPADLKARMDAVEEDINWSALACRAFEQRLAEVISRKGALDMKDVINRLRASKQSMEEGRYKEGFDDGQTWAKNHAEAEELVRLADLRARCLRDGVWDYGFEPFDESAYSPGECFVFAIMPEGEADRSDAHRFWEANAGQDHEALSSDGAYVKGFGEGALRIWGQVKDQI